MGVTLQASGCMIAKRRVDLKRAFRGGGVGAGGVEGKDGERGRGSVREEEGVRYLPFLFH